jgi:PAS domain S-box-containing protein
MPRLATGLRAVIGAASYARLVHAFMAMFVVASCAGLFYARLQERTSLLELQAQRIQGEALAFEEHASRTLQLVENTLLAMRGAIDQPMQQVPRARLEALLEKLLSNQPAIRSLSVMTAAEGIRASTNPGNIGKRVDLADMLPIDLQTGERSTLRIGPAWVGRDLDNARLAAGDAPEGRTPPRFIPLAMRLGPQMDPVWVVATLNPDYLTSRNDRLRDAATEQYLMARLDGAVLLSSNEGEIGTTLQSSGRMARALAGSTGLDMQDGITAFRSSSRHPFVIWIRMDTNAVLAAWQTRTLLMIGIAVFILTGTVGLTLLLLRRIRAAEVAEREQQDAIRLLSQAMEQNPNGILIINAAGVVEYCNARFCGQSGYSETETVGRPIAALDHERMLENADVRDQQIQDALKSGASWTNLVVMRHRNGERYSVNVTLATLRGAAEQVTHHLRIEHDVSEQVEAFAKLNAGLEKRVTERTNALRIANQELESYSYSVAHDLRTPLRMIVGFSQILRTRYGGTLDAEFRRMQEDVTRAGKNMGALIDELLAMARVGQGPVERADTDLSALAQQVFDQIPAPVGKPRAAFIIAPGLAAHVDATLMHAMLFNLISNAVKYSAQNPSPQIEFGASGAGDDRTFFVRDNGIGFDMATADKLFQPFQRLHAGSQFPGMGIGLATARKIIDRHGGRLWAEASPDNGATFFFTVQPGTAL